MYTKILLASDGSEGALKAAEAAAFQARQSEASLTVLYVISIPAQFTPLAGMPGVTIGPEVFQQYSDLVKDEATRRTEQVLEKTSVAYTMRYELGNVAEVVMRLVQQEAFDLVVLGNRGLEGFSSFLLGSVSNRVADHASCSVLVVK